MIELGITRGRGIILVKQLFPSCIIIGIFLALFSICYSSVLINDYGFLDEYFDIIPGNQEPVVKKRIIEGRPLYAVIYGSITSGGMYIEDLRWFRLAGIAGLSLLAFSVFRVLVYVGWDRFQSFCVSSILCVTLPFQLYVAWATTSIFIFASLISGLALLLTDRAVDAKKRKTKWIFVSGAILILFSAITIYQNAAMFFWVLAAIIVLKPEATFPDIFRRFGWYVFVCVVAFILGYITFKLGTDPHHEFSEKGDLSFDILGKITLLLKILCVVFNFPFLSPYHFFFFPADISYNFAYVHEFDKRFVIDAVIAVIVFSVITAGLWLYFRGSAKERVLKCAGALFLLPLSCIPSLVINIDFLAYRVLSAPVSLVVLYAYFSFHGYMRLRKSRVHALENASLAAAVYSMMLLADYHVDAYFVTPQVEELAVMRFPLERQNVSQAKSIHVIRPAPGGRESLAPLLWLEYGTPSSMPAWSAHSMIFHILRGLSPDHAHKLVTSISATAHDLIKPLPGSLVVDMQNLPVRLRAYRWIDGESVPGALVHSSVFDIYMDDDNFYYVKDPCSHQDTASPFFLHVTPPSPDSLPDHRKQYGWDNLDFGFIWYGVLYEDKCMAIVRRPDYTDAHVSTGQYVRDGDNLWTGTFRIEKGIATP